MKHNPYIQTLVIIASIVVVVMGFSLVLFPEWLASSQNILILVGIAIITAVPLVHYFFSTVKNMRGQQENTKESNEIKNVGTWIGGDANIDGDFVGRDKVTIYKTDSFPADGKDQIRRTQEMSNSELGEQTIKGKGGVMEQRMKNSPGGKQSME